MNSVLHAGPNARARNARVPLSVLRGSSCVKLQGEIRSKMPLPIMLDHQETKVRTSKVLTKIRNGQVARFCAIGARANAP